MLLFLVGYMGSGKSSLGRKIARRLSVRYVDTDSVIEQREGASVSDIFYYEGEERFRELERETIEECIASGEDAVVSTGGGLPVWRDNMALMNSAGMTVYIRRTPEQIISRLSPYGRQRRPKFRGLSDEELLAFMRSNMAEREPFYSQAHKTVDCTAMNDTETVEFIINSLTENE